MRRSRGESVFGADLREPEVVALGRGSSTPARLALSMWNAVRLSKREARRGEREHQQEGPHNPTSMVGSHVIEIERGKRAQSGSAGGDYSVARLVYGLSQSLD